MTAGPEALLERFVDELETARTPEQVESARIKYLGQKGLITGFIRGTDFGAMAPEDRRQVGRVVSQLKASAERALQAAQSRVEAMTPQGDRRQLLDLTIPGDSAAIGSMQPVAIMQMFVEDIFRGMGFLVEQGYEVETEFFNFDALNMPADHPARDMQDTFWLENGLLLRTHTSASQVRALRRHGVPLRAIFPGRCFRYESVDPSHETTFYQCEGLMVDRGVTVAVLLGVMQALLTQVFGREVEIRLRPGYFPFVEPGFELDLQCLICDGAGCRTCKQTGWIELMPCGMVHPRVLEAGNVDPDHYSGFAFGLGLTRLAMMKFGIPDIRLFHSGDLRFYQQFPATA
jgi:phenylalanyl-tRNA synthetase alpha chain